MRMSAIRQETWLSRLDFSRLAARANTAAEKPADSSRSLVVSRIDSSSSTIATSGPLGTSISRWAVEATLVRADLRDNCPSGGRSRTCRHFGREWYAGTTPLVWIAYDV